MGIDVRIFAHSLCLCIVFLLVARIPSAALPCS